MYTSKASGNKTVHKNVHKILHEHYQLLLQIS